VGHLEINPGSNGGLIGSGGVNIDARDIELVLSPDIDLDQDIGLSALFLLAQSTADFANTLMSDVLDLDEEAVDSTDGIAELDASIAVENRLRSGSNSSGSSSNSATKKPSALSGVMAKAVEMALAKLRVKLVNVKIKIVSDLTDVILEIDELNFSTQNGVRNIVVTGVRFITLRPDVTPTNYEQDKPEDYLGKNEEKPEDDYEVDEIDESLLGSMVFTHEEASSIYMSAIDQSFEHGSDDSQSGGENGGNKPKISKPSPTTVMYINTVQIDFEGLSPIFNLTIRVDSVKASLTPLFSTIVSVLSGITMNVKLKEYQKRKRNYNKLAGDLGASRFPQYSNDDEIYDDDENGHENGELEEALVFNKIHITRMELSTTSPLLHSGEFATYKTVNIIIQNFNVKQKSESYTFGGIEILKLMKGEQEIFSFKSNPNFEMSQDELESSVISTGQLFSSPVQPKPHRADIRFEIITNEGQEKEVVVLLSKQMTFRLDASVFATLCDMLESALDISTSITSLSSALELLHSINRPKFIIENKINLPPSTQFILQTSDIFVELLMSMTSNIRASISPIHFNLLQNKCSISQVVFTRMSGGLESKIGSISDARLNIKNEEFITFVNRYQSSNGSNVLPRDVKMVANTSIKVGNVEFELCLDELKQLIGELSEYFDKSAVLRMKRSMHYQKSSSVHDPVLQSLHLSKPRKTVRLGISNTHNLTYNGPKLNICSFLLRIANISIKVNNVSPMFGSLVIGTNDVSIYQLKDDIHGSIPTVDAYRYFEGEIVEYFLHPYKNKNNFSFPLILIHFKNNEKVKSLDVTIRNMLVEYHTYWLELLGKSNLASNNVHKPEENQPISKHRAENQNANGIQSSNFDIRFTLYDCVCGLNPLRLKCKSYVVVGKGTSDIIFANDQVSLKSSLRNISVLLIDDWNNEVDGKEVNMNNHKSGSQTYVSPSTHYLSHGYINIANINVAHVGISINTNIEKSVERNKLLGIKDNLALIDFKINSDEHIVELCADSAHTFLQMINDLKLPLNYTDADRAKVTLDKDLNLLDDINMSQYVRSKPVKIGSGRDFESKDEGAVFEIQHPFKTAGTDKCSDDSELESTIRNVSTLTFDEDHFSGTNKVDDGPRVTPLKMNLNFCKVKVYIYDGYDWKTTRKTIKGAAKRVETKLKKRKDKVTNYGEQLDENIEENVFNSIYLTMPSDQHVEDFTRSINEKVQNDKPLDGTSKRLETSPEVSKNYKNLKLRRSNYHKILFDVRSVEVDVSIFSSRDPRYEPTDDNLETELLNMVEVRLNTICIYDNLPSSTWNKFLSYMNILGEREIGTSMLKLSITNVRPDPHIVSCEARVEVSVLPLRLHIDQDTLEFLTRFFDFKDERFYLPPDEDIYFQRFKTGPIRLKIDYKPKTVDYIGLRSGNTGELINFFILDGSEMTLQLINTHGILGMNRLGRRLGSIWGPQIQHTQIGGLLAGVSLVKSIVNITGGMKDLIVIPIQEYKKDGRILRSLKKGTSSFAKTTGYELFNLGAKLASGAQVWLEQGEEYLGGEGQAIRQPHKADMKKAKQNNEDNLDFLEFDDSEKIKRKSKKDLLASSQMLNRTIKLGKDQFGGSKQYSYIDIDDEMYDEEIAEEDERTFLGVSMLMLDSVSKPKQIKGKLDEMDESDNDDDDDDTLEQEKLISLYSNQPATIEEGIKSAYRSLGKNLVSTKKVILRLKDDVNDAENFQEAFITVAKSSPIVLIRPLIGTTEAISKTFMGIGNEIDPKKMIESKDKYRYDET
jgi:autophagy-related protein 2